MQTTLSKCSCCHSQQGTEEECPISPLAPSDAQADALEAVQVRRELRLIGLSAGLLVAVLLAESWLEETFGRYILYLAYGIPYLLCGTAIFREAFEHITNRDYLNEFTLMCGATIAAIILGELPEAVGVMLFYRTGEFVQERASAGSRRSIKGLLASKPTFARVFDGQSFCEVPVEQVQVSQHLQVRAGEKIPLDGVVLEGASLVDQSPLTGEPVPVSARPGVTVMAGSINLDGLITIEATSQYADTQMARILEMVENAALHKAPTERFITRFARYYTPLVVFLALLTAILPPLFLQGATFEEWVYRALVLLVISCPCALLISVPLGYFGGIGAASRQGILVKGGNVLDSLLHVDTVVFDKTGTLTRGVFQVAAVSPAPGRSARDLMEAAIGLESHSNHPIARSVVAFGQAERIQALPVFNVREIPGLGIAGEVDGGMVLAGSGALMSQYGIQAPPVSTDGALVHVALGEDYLGHILISDLIREESRGAVQSLQALGKRTFMLTGDRPEAARQVAETLGLDGFQAGLLPEDKVRAMEELSGSSRTAFVGDGINDAPILAVSRVGIAMGGIGAQAAVEAADAVILNDSPASVARLFSLARSVRFIVWQNIILALTVKTLFMGLGIVGLSGLWEAVFADVGVALLAVLNATRVMRK